MSRAERLLEILITLRSRPRFTVKEMADEMGVSRRTMLRDLQALSEIGVPLQATPGPYGGYSLVTRSRLLPLSLTVEEAIGMVLSYEAFLRYAESPFSAQSGSAITKLRNAMSPDVVRELDRLRAYVSVDEPARQYRAPHLAEILQAALDGIHLRIVYESASGIAERVVFPYGLYAQQGFWYCACFDYRRRDHLSLRADRIRAVERLDDMERPEPISLRDWLHMRRTTDDRLPLYARTTRRGAASLELEVLFGPVRTDGRGNGIVQSWIPAAEVDFYAARLLTLGTELTVEEPPELIQAMVEKARAVASQYKPR